MGVANILGMTMNATPHCEITLLDSRFKGSKHFTYRSKIFGDYSKRYPQFIEIRNWCWDTWGFSCERDILIKLADKGENFIRPWAWHCEYSTRGYFDTYIYLATDQELSLFKLKWC